MKNWDFPVLLKSTKKIARNEELSDQKALRLSQRFEASSLDGFNR